MLVCRVERRVIIKLFPPVPSQAARTTAQQQWELPKKTQDYLSAAHESGQELGLPVLGAQRQKRVGDSAKLPKRAVKEPGFGASRVLLGASVSAGRAMEHLLRHDKGCNN